MDVICASGVHDTLCTAINLAGLTDALNGDGDWTVFGPTDEAFAKLGDKLDEIIADPDLLTNILLFHAVDDRIESGDLECTVRVEMANGQDSRTVCTGHGSNTVFHQKGGGNPSNDMPEIIAVDIETCQGYIHVVGKSSSWFVGFARGATDGTFCTHDTNYSASSVPCPLLPW